MQIDYQGIWRPFISFSMRQEMFHVSIWVFGRSYVTCHRMLWGELCFFNVCVLGGFVHSTFMMHLQQPRRVSEIMLWYSLACLQGLFLSMTLFDHVHNEPYVWRVTGL